MKIEMMDPNKIKPDPNQPRKTFDEEKIRLLAETYKIEGMITPIEVDEKLKIIIGERRWKAAILARLKKIPVVVNPSKNRLQRQLIEEFQKENISPLERAKALRTFQEKTFSGKDHEKNIFEVSKRIGSYPTYVRKLFTLLESKKLMEAVEKGKIDPFVAIAAKEKFGEKRAIEIAQSDPEIQPTVVQIEEEARLAKISEALQKGFEGTRFTKDDWFFQLQDHSTKLLDLLKPQAIRFLDYEQVRNIRLFAHELLKSLQIFERELEAWK